MFLALFPVVDPIGVLPSFLGLTSRSTVGQRVAIALQAALASTAVLTFFLFAGRFVLHHFGISLGALQVAGGIVVGITGVRMILDQHDSAETTEATDHPPPQVAFSPLTIPLLAGPGAIGVVIAVQARGHGRLHALGFVVGIIAIGAVILLSLALGARFGRFLRPNLLDALTRIMGLIVLAIAVELVLHGLSEHFREKHPKLRQTTNASGLVTPL